MRPRPNRNLILVCGYALTAVPLLGPVFEPVSAQSPVFEGQRVRVTMNNGGVVIGTVVGTNESQSMTLSLEPPEKGETERGGRGLFFDADIVVNPGPENRPEADISFSDVRLLELSAGFRSGMLEGAKYGVMVGCALGLAAGLGADKSELLDYILSGGVVGGLGGLYVGHKFLSRERWNVSPQFRSWGSGSSGAGVRFSYRIN